MKFVKIVASKFCIIIIISIVNFSITGILIKFMEFDYKFHKNKAIMKNAKYI